MSRKKDHDLPWDDENDLTNENDQQEEEDTTTAIYNKDLNEIRITTSDPDAVKQCVSEDSHTFTLVRKKKPEIITHIKGSQGRPGNTARIVLQPWAFDIRNAPKHVQDDFIEGVYRSFMRFMKELAKDPVKMAEFKEQSKAEYKEFMKRKKEREKGKDPKR